MSCVSLLSPVLLPFDKFACLSSCSSIYCHFVLQMQISKLLGNGQSFSPIEYIVNLHNHLFCLCFIGPLSLRSSQIQMLVFYS